MCIGTRFRSMASNGFPAPAVRKLGRNTKSKQTKEAVRGRRSKPGSLLNATTIPEVLRCNNDPTHVGRTTRHDIRREGFIAALTANQSDPFATKREAAAQSSRPIDGTHGHTAK